MLANERTLDDVRRRLRDRFRGAATVIIAKPRLDETEYTAAVACNGYSYTFRFHVAGRHAAEIEVDLVKEIVDWMESLPPRPA